MRGLSGCTLEAWSGAKQSSSLAFQVRAGLSFLRPRSRFALQEFTESRWKITVAVVARKTACSGSIAAHRATLRFASIRRCTSPGGDGRGTGHSVASAIGAGRQLGLSAVAGPLLAHPPDRYDDRNLTHPDMSSLHVSFSDWCSAVDFGVAVVRKGITIDRPHSHQSIAEAISAPNRVTQPACSATPPGRPVQYETARKSPSSIRWPWRKRFQLRLATSSAANPRHRIWSSSRLNRFVRLAA